MCGSIVGIQSATAEIRPRRGKRRKKKEEERKKKEEERTKHRTKI